MERDRARVLGRFSGCRHSTVQHRAVPCGYLVGGHQRHRSVYPATFIPPAGALERRDVPGIPNSTAGSASMKRIKHRTHDGSRVIVLAGAAGDVAKSQSSYTAISFTSLSVSPNRSSTPLPLPVVSEVVKLVYPSQCLHGGILAVFWRGIRVPAPAKYIGQERTFARRLHTGPTAERHGARSDRKTPKIRS